MTAYNSIEAYFLDPYEIIITNKWYEPKKIRLEEITIWDLSEDHITRPQLKEDFKKFMTTYNLKETSGYKYEFFYTMVYIDNDGLVEAKFFIDLIDKLVKYYENLYNK